MWPKPQDVEDDHVQCNGHEPVGRQAAALRDHGIALVALDAFAGGVGGRCAGNDAFGDDRGNGDADVDAQKPGC